MKYSQEIESIVTFFKTAADEHRMSTAAVIEKNQEIQDLEHELELAATDAKSRARIGRELQKVLKSRRQHKNIAESTEPIAAFVSEHQKLMNELSALLGKVRKVEKYHETRQYIPRVRTDLTISTQTKR